MKLRLHPDVSARLLQLRTDDHDLYARLYARIVLIRDDPQHHLARGLERWLPESKQMGRVSTIDTYDKGTWAIAWTLDPDTDNTIYVRWVECALS